MVKWFLTGTWNTTFRMLLSKLQLCYWKLLNSSPYAKVTSPQNYESHKLTKVKIIWTIWMNDIFIRCINHACWINNKHNQSQAKLYG
jgi:hypothetical protein